MKVGDSGFVLKIDTRANLSNLSGATVRLRRPDNTVVDHVNQPIAAPDPPATIPTAVNYTIQAGDFTVPGVYRVAVIVLAATEVVQTDALEIYVGPSL